MTLPRAGVQCAQNFARQCRADGTVFAQRPVIQADTLTGSKHANMKELRCTAAYGVWRIAFDRNRQAILLVGGDKSGGSEKRFYKSLIAQADDSFNRHLERRKE